MSSASVEVEGEVVGSIGKGLLVLVGIGREDTETDAEFIIQKMAKMRLFTHPETNRPWDLSVIDAGGSILCVSQFTLFGRLKGNKPDFSRAKAPQEAKEMYDSFLGKLRRVVGDPGRVQDGKFGAMMDVKLVNDGPVTFTLDSQDRSNII